MKEFPILEFNILMLILKRRSFAILREVPQILYTDEKGNFFSNGYINKAFSGRIDLSKLKCYLILRNYEEK